MAPLVFFSLADGYMGSDKKEEDNADNRTEPSFIASTKKKYVKQQGGRRRFHHYTNPHESRKTCIR